MRESKKLNRGLGVVAMGGLERLEDRRLLAGGVALDGVVDGAVDGALDVIARGDGELAGVSDVVLPKTLTKQERAYLDRLAREGTQLESNATTPTPPPTGVLEPVAEHEAMEALVISWSTAFPTAWRSNLATMTRHVTVEGNGRMYIGVPSTTSRNDATTRLTAAGANLSNVVFFTVPLNSIWARDYGPRYVYEGDVRIVTDHRYYSSRPQDDDQPIVFTNLKQQPYYEMGVGATMFNHGGGNYHLDDDGDAWATRLVSAVENPTLSESAIVNMWRQYQGTETTLTNQYPFSVDGTGHIDMWMQIYDTRKVFISDWPNNPGSAQDVISDSTATLMAARGYQVTRLPSYLIGGVHYTYTNMVVFNNVIMVPIYNNGPGATVSTAALQTIRDAAPGMQVFGINADSIITASGAFHCIVQHVPMHRGAAGPNGGQLPTAFIRELVDTSLEAGQVVPIRWITDDEAITTAAGARPVTLRLSTDGGETFTTIASNQASNGTFNWTVPSNVVSGEAILRAEVRDVDGNVGFDDTNVNITIGQLSVPAAPTLLASSDSGLSASDGVTNFNNGSPARALSYRVTNVTPGATVEVLIDNVVLASGVATGTSIDLSSDGVTAIADGAYVVSVRQTSGVLQANGVGTQALRIDATAPVIVSAEYAFDAASPAVRFGSSEIASNVNGVSMTNLTTGATFNAGQIATSLVGGVDPVYASSVVGGFVDGNWRIDLPAGALSDVAGNASEAFSANFFVLAGDANRDRVVGFADLLIVARNYGLSGQLFSQGDFDYDGVVGFADLLILSRNYNVGVPVLRTPSLGTSGGWSRTRIGDGMFA